jgi:uncharacterized protein YodC (DUF2158 family)
MQCASLYDIGSTAIQRPEQTQVTDKQFQPGDVVSLRSGGPRMTVAMISGPNAFCEWFTDDQHLQSRSFVVTSLKFEQQHFEEQHQESM